MIYTSYLTNNELQEIFEVLESIGIKPSEQQVYITLIQLGPSTISPISKATELPLTTVQSVLQRLCDKRLVSFSKNKSRHVYKAEHVSVLKQLVQDQERGINNIIPLLKKLTASFDSSQNVKIFTGKNIQNIFHEALKAKSKIIYEIVSAKDIQDLLGEKFHFSKRRIEKKVHLKSLRVQAHEIKKYSQEINTKELREVHFLPKELDFHSSFMMWDNTVAFFTTRSDGFAWTVENETNRATFKALFDFLWKISKNLTS
jgi:sugar-specific transcriptional regulator TrmB